MEETEETYINLSMPETHTNNEQGIAMKGITRVLAAFSNKGHCSNDINLYHRDLFCCRTPHYVAAKAHELHAPLPSFTDITYTMYSNLSSDTAVAQAMKNGFVHKNYAELKKKEYVSIQDVEDILQIAPIRRYYSKYEIVHTRRIACLVYRAMPDLDVLFCCLLFFVRTGVCPVPPPFLHPDADLATHKMQMFFINCICRPGNEIAKNL